MADDAVLEVHVLRGKKELLAATKTGDRLWWVRQIQKLWNFSCLKVHGFPLGFLEERQRGLFGEG
jgi:hypothetical protein